MANKQFSDLTAATTIAKGDLLAIQGSLGSRKVDAVLTGIAFGTSFPGSPASGDRFHRTDRQISYKYDGTRWLSDQVFILSLSKTNAPQPQTANGSAFEVNPWSGTYDIYVEALIICSNNSATTASNYFTFTLKTLDGVTETTLGSSISTQNLTQNAWIKQEQSINSVVSSTIDAFKTDHIESGTASIFHMSMIRYRVVG